VEEKISDQKKVKRAMKMYERWGSWNIWKRISSAVLRNNLAYYPHSPNSMHLKKQQD